MAEQEKKGVRGMTGNKARRRSVVKSRNHLVTLKNFNGDHDNQGVRGEPPNLSGSVGCKETQDICPETRAQNDPSTDPTRREPVPITCAWPRRSLEAVLAKLRESGGSSDYNPQQPEFPSSGPLPPSSQPMAVYRNFKSKENSSSDNYAPNLDEPDSRSEDGENLSGEESSEEGDDSLDIDYIPTDDCKDQDPLIGQLEPAGRRSSRKRTIEEKRCAESPGPLLDSSKRRGSNVLVFKRSKICGGEEWSVVPIDEGQMAAQKPVSVSQGSLSGSRGKLHHSRRVVRCVPDTGSQVVTLNHDDEVGSTEDWLSRNSGEDTLFGIVEQIEQLQEKCRTAKQILLRCKESSLSLPNSTYNLRSAQKGRNVAINHRGKRHNRGT